jgi:poly-gamma-glutamate synthesis protein (capsule biosynthesis protein)
MPRPLTLLAVGDIAPRVENPREQLTKVAPVLRSGDITFGQLEVPLSGHGTRQLHPGFRGRGGSAGNDAVDGARILAEAGFSVMSLAGNHTMDRSAPAMLESVRAAAEQGVRLIGAGEDIAAARRPAVLEVDGTTVGFLAYCSVLPRGFEAARNKPGVAPLRARTLYEQVDWQPGTPPRIITHTHREDLAAMVTDVAELRRRADVVVVSMHWGIHFEPGTIADYQYEAAHAAVDAGADVILGHHSHVIKAVEYYRGRPIFHGMGNLTLLPRGDRGEPLVEGGRVDAQMTMIAKITVVDKAIARVAVLPCWLDRRLEPETVRAGDPRFDDVFAYLRRANDLPSSPRNPWEALYLQPVPESLPLREVRFEADGDEIVVRAPAEPAPPRD